MAATPSSDLQLCRYCYGTIVKLPGVCSNCRHFWSRDERGALRCQFGGQSTPMSNYPQHQAGYPVNQQQNRHQEQSHHGTSLNVPLTLPYDKLFATASSTTTPNQPRPGLSTARAYETKSDLSGRNMKPPEMMEKSLPSPLNTSAMPSGTPTGYSSVLPRTGTPTAASNMSTNGHQEALVPRLRAMPDHKSIPIIKIDFHPSTAARVPENDSAVSEIVQLGQCTSSPPETQSPKNESVATSIRRYTHAELLDVYAGISRKVFMTSSLSEGFWKQTQALGILHPNSYFFRDLNSKLHGSSLM